MDVETNVGWHTCSASFKKFIWHFQKKQTKKIIKCPQKLWNKSKAAALSGCGSTDHGIPSSWARGMPAQLHCGATGAKIKHIFLIFLFAIRVSGNAEGKKKNQGFWRKVVKEISWAGEQFMFAPKGCSEKLLYSPTSLRGPGTPSGFNTQWLPQDGQLVLNLDKKMFQTLPPGLRKVMTAVPDSLV